MGADPNLPLGIRVGNAERAAAVRALDVHLETGRLDAEEYGVRYALASEARTRGDLSVLFRDLPLPHGLTPPSDDTRPTIRQRPRANAASGRNAELPVAVVGFVILVVCLAFGMPWLVFALLPLFWVLANVHARGHDRRRHHNRRKNF